MSLQEASDHIFAEIDDDLGPVIEIGDSSSRQWIYSARLFPSPENIEDAILKFVGKAQEGQWTFPLIFINDLDNIPAVTRNIYAIETFNGQYVAQTLDENRRLFLAQYI